MQLDFLYSLFEMVLITFLVIVIDCLFDKSNLEETSFILGSQSGKVESVMRGETRDLGRLIAGATVQEPIEYVVWEVRKQRTWGGGLASTHPPNPSPSPGSNALWHDLKCTSESHKQTLVMLQQIGRCWLLLQFGCKMSLTGSYI